MGCCEVMKTKRIQQLRSVPNKRCVLGWVLLSTGHYHGAEPCKNHKNLKHQKIPDTTLGQNPVKIKNKNKRIKRFLTLPWGRTLYKSKNNKQNQKIPDTTLGQNPVKIKKPKTSKDS
jgi:hypothetical protein